jgi:hypothetical protein
MIVVLVELRNLVVHVEHHLLPTIHASKIDWVVYENVFPLVICVVHKFHWLLLVDPSSGLEH